MKTVFSKKRLLSGVLSVVMLLTALLSVTTMTQAASTNLRTHISKVQGLFEDINSGNVDDTEHGNVSRVTETVIDGDTSTGVDAYTAFTWDPPKNLGVRMELDALYYVEKVVLYSGASSHPDILKVYASDKLSDLYAGMNLVAENLECTGNAVTVNVGRNAQYVAIFVTGGADGDCWRTREFEIHGTVPAENPVNLLSEHMAAINGVQMTKETGEVVTTDKFGADLLAKLTDGKIHIANDAFDLSGAENDTYYYGVQMTLDAVYTLSSVVLHQGLSYNVNSPENTYMDVVDVYAADTLADLYKEENRIATGIEEIQPYRITTTIDAKYVAVIFTGGMTYGSARPREYEVYGFAGTASANPLTATGAGILSQELINGKQGLRFNNWLVTKVVDGEETVTVGGKACKVTGIGMLVTKRTGAEMTVENAADAANGILNGKVTSAKNVIVDEEKGTVAYDFSILVKNVDYANIETVVSSRAYVEYQDGDETKVLYGDVQTTSVKAMYDSLPASRFSDAVKNWMATGEVGE